MAGSRASRGGGGSGAADPRSAGGPGMRGAGFEEGELGMEIGGGTGEEEEEEEKRE